MLQLLVTESRCLLPVTSDGSFIHRQLRPQVSDLVRSVRTVTTRERRWSER